MKPSVDKPVSIDSLMSWIASGSGKAMGRFGGIERQAIVLLFQANKRPAAYTSGFLLIIGLLTRMGAITLVTRMIIATSLVGFRHFSGLGAGDSCLFGARCLPVLLSGPMLCAFDFYIFT